MGDGFLKRSKVSTIIIGVVMLLLGITFFFFPGAATLTLVYLCGWGFLVAGIVTLINFIARKDDRSAVDLAFSILELILGLLILIWPGLFLIYVFVMIGVVVIVTGVADISDAVQLKSIEGSSWGWLLALGILTLIFGLLVIFAPIFFAEVVMIIAGIALVFDGVTEIVAGVRM